MLIREEGARKPFNKVLELRALRKELEVSRAREASLEQALNEAYAYMTNMQRNLEAERASWTRFHLALSELSTVREPLSNTLRDDIPADFFTTRKGN